MKNTNEKGNLQNKKHSKVTVLIESYINVFYTMGVITPEAVEELRKISEGINTINEASEIIEKIKEMTDLTIENKAVSEIKDDIDTAHKLLESIKELGIKEKKTVFDVIGKVELLIKPIETKKPLLKDEIIHNIEIFRSKAKDDNKFDKENISVILSMLNHFSVIQKNSRSV